jgi:hypothetical protein
MVEGVMDAGTREYQFAQTQWFLETSMVQALARLRRSERGRAPDGINMIDMELAAAEILGYAANIVRPISEEGMLAIGEARRMWHHPRTLRYTAAARARGNTGDTAGRSWRQEHRDDFVALIARELYRMIYFPDEDAVLSE